MVKINEKAITEFIKRRFGPVGEVHDKDIKEEVKKSAKIDKSIWQRKK